MRNHASYSRWWVLVLAAGWVSRMASGQVVPSAAAQHPATAPSPDAQSVAAQVARARTHAQASSWEDVAGTLGPIERHLDPEGGLLLAEALRQTGQPAKEAATLRRALDRFPTHADLWLAWIDAALRQQQWAAALERTRAAVGRLGASPALYLRTAQAHFGLGQVLGAVQVREVEDGHPGQFAGGWLVLEPRGPGRFLCCPQQSALNQLRRALDGGLDEPAAHLLHARIWQQAGKPQVGFALLKSREAMLLESGATALEQCHTLATFAELALAADALDDYLHYSRMQAAAQPARRGEILGEAYLAVAERYVQRGEATLCREFSYRALRLRPDDVELMLRVAEAEWSAGRTDEAAGWYRRILERKPDHPARARILERLAARPNPN